MNMYFLYRNSRWPPKMAGKWFLGKFASRFFIYPACQKINWNWSILHHLLDKCVFAFYAEIQDGRQKWQESDFCEKSSVHPADTLRVQNFFQISLSHTVSEMCFCVLRRNLRWPLKMAGKWFFAKSCQNTLWIPTLWLKNFAEIALSHTVSEILKICKKNHAV